MGETTTIGIRVGLGHDTHRLRPGGPLRLGGIDIPHDREAVGHSDADVLLHAVTDALLGAAALGDIGQMFPDTDPENRGRDSAEMLRAALDAVAALGWRIVNIDCIVFAQRPKLLRIVRRFANAWPTSSASSWSVSACRPRPASTLGRSVWKMRLPPSASHCWKRNEKAAGRFPPTWH